ncbi:cytochrome c553 [Methylophaga lonarensis MPL]|uniref:Cytochrome c553 n=1 Tax=Methylophaga lonarensis MPL TaxID=1286106 RepID=M7PUT1_9GAMM|nr:cytochrome c [Methylophaga lonarensis]EMR14214.1 cytochrome c553 [Methylophaga lonarensis MPL]
MKNMSRIALMTLIGLNAQAVIAEGDISAGKAGSAICATCHGANGIATMPIYPNLAGQNYEYLVSALTAYRDKQRHGQMAMIMQMQASNLSDEDIRNLSAFYSSLKPE